MYTYNIPDHPDIRRMEREGYPDEPPVVCPVCGKECETLFKDWNGDIVGCDNCITQINYWEIAI